MYLHITPSFNIDRLCKTASVLLFLVNKAVYVIVDEFARHAGKKNQGVLSLVVGNYATIRDFLSRLRLFSAVSTCSCHAWPITAKIASKTQIFCWCLYVSDVDSMNTWKYRYILSSKMKFTRLFVTICCRELLFPRLFIATSGAKKEALYKGQT